MCDCGTNCDSIVCEWMEEYKALTESEIHTYAAEQEHNIEVIAALYVVLEDPKKVKDGQVAKNYQNYLLYIERESLLIKLDITIILLESYSFCSGLTTFCLIF